MSINSVVLRVMRFWLQVGVIVWAAFVAVCANE